MEMMRLSANLVSVCFALIIITYPVKNAMGMQLFSNGQSYSDLYQVATSQKDSSWKRGVNYPSVAYIRTTGVTASELATAGNLLLMEANGSMIKLEMGAFFISMAAILDDPERLRLIEEEASRAIAEENALNLTSCKTIDFESQSQENRKKCHYIARDSRRSDDWDIGLSVLNSLCDVDYAQSCVRLFNYYVHRDKKLAVEIAKKACQPPSWSGCEALASVYHNGTGDIKIDRNKTKEIYSKMCKAGSQIACNTLKTYSTEILTLPENASDNLARVADQCLEENSSLKRPKLYCECLILASEKPVRSLNNTELEVYRKFTRFPIPQVSEIADFELSLSRFNDQSLVIGAMARMPALAASIATPCVTMSEK